MQYIRLLAIIGMVGSAITGFFLLPDLSAYDNNSSELHSDLHVIIKVLKKQNTDPEIKRYLESIDTSVPKSNPTHFGAKVLQGCMYVFTVMVGLLLISDEINKFKSYELSEKEKEHNQEVKET